MSVEELIEKLDSKTKENLWDIFVDDNEYFFETDLETQNKEIKKWDLEYSLVDHFFQLTLRIYTVDYEPYFFEEFE